MTDMNEMIIGEEMELFTIMTQKGWQTAHGHSIKAFGYKFFCAPFGSEDIYQWSITESETGARLFLQNDSSGSGSYEEVMLFLYTVVAVRIFKVLTNLQTLDNFETFNKQIDKLKKDYVERWGVMPTAVMH